MPFSLIAVVGLGWMVTKCDIKKLMLGTYFVNNLGLVFLFFKFLVLNWFVEALRKRGFNVDIDSRTNCKSCTQLNQCVLDREKNLTDIPEDLHKSLWVDLFTVNLFIVFSEQNMVLWFARISEVADERFGATIMTLCSSLSYTTEFLAKTIGLALVDQVRSYYRFVMVCFAISVLTAVISFFVARNLDEKKKEDFMIKGEISQRNTLESV